MVKLFESVFPEYYACFNGTVLSFFKMFSELKEIHLFKLIFFDTILFIAGSPGFMQSVSKILKL